MYKVFIKDKVINFVETGSFSAQPEEIFIDPSFRDIQTLLNDIDSDEQHTDFYFASEDAEKLFISFYTRMRIITAAGGTVVNENNEVLFIFRRGRWDLPKGKIDNDETEEQAAIREVTEETGLQKISLGKRLPSTYHVYTIGKEWILKETHWFIMKASIDEKLLPQADEGITEIKWVAKNGLPKMSKLVYRSLCGVVQDVDGIV
ncbi:MAG TPA: NUDIX domain-containing protein [Bacteroidales bacterium]|nr:NUDIX domain-containing protein [Bacteroidales bacterium]HPS83213.1 NUDIX domain-containing protein [Bacteroidales bacterium]